MSELFVVRPLLQMIALELEQCEYQMRGMAKTVETLSASYCIRSSFDYFFQADLNTICHHMEESTSDLNRCSTILNQCIQLYYRTEQQIMAGSDSQYLAEQLQNHLHSGSSGSFAEEEPELQGSLSVEQTWHSWNKENEWASIHAQAGNVHASARWNLGSVEGPFGIPLPNVSASAAAGLSAVSLSAEAEIGTSLLGASAHGEVTGGSAEAYGRITAGLFENNQFSPNLAVGVSAHAVAAEAVGELQGNLLGAVGTIHGAVNFGIGASADFGYEEGVFRWDLGASLGVGIRIGAELDLSQPIEAIQNVLDMLVELTTE